MLRSFEPVRFAFHRHLFIRFSDDIQSFELGQFQKKKYLISVFLDLLPRMLADRGLGGRRTGHEPDRGTVVWGSTVVEGYGKGRERYGRWEGYDFVPKF